MHKNTHRQLYTHSHTHTLKFLIQNTFGITIATLTITAKFAAWYNHFVLFCHSTAKASLQYLKIQHVSLGSFPLTWIRKWFIYFLQNNNGYDKELCHWLRQWLHKETENALKILIFKIFLPKEKDEINLCNFWNFNSCSSVISNYIMIPLLCSVPSFPLSVSFRHLNLDFLE